MQQTKPIMEELARARNHFRRHDVLRALVSLATALKAAAQAQLIGRDRSLVDNALLEVVQQLNRTQEVQTHCPDPDGLTLEKGKLKPLFLNVMTVIKKVREEAATETLEQTRARKLELDSQLGRGQKFLDAGNPAEADKAFQEALKSYVDEHKIFYMIASSLQRAGHPQAALKYLAKGLEVDPEPLPLVLAAARCHLMLEDHAKAEELLLQHIKGLREPEAFALLAQAQAAQNKADKALRSAAFGLKIDPGHKPSRKLYSQLRKARSRAAKAKAAS